MNTITSKDNPQVKQLKRMLNQPKRSDAWMVIEGIHVCQAFVEHGARPNRVWVSESGLHNPEITTLLERLGVLDTSVYVLSDAVFREISSLDQGVSLALEVARPRHDLADIQSLTHVVLLDGIQDPGNMGSIIRSAAASGVSHLFLSTQCVNPFSPKVLRAAVGAHVGVQIVESCDLDEVIDLLRTLHIQVIGTSSHTDLSIYQMDLKPATAWLLGNEGAGVSDQLLDKAHALAQIPMMTGESLNVAAAAAVCFFETARQRLG